MNIEHIWNIFWQKISKKYWEHKYLLVLFYVYLNFLKNLKYKVSCVVKLAIYATSKLPEPSICNFDRTIHCHVTLWPTPSP